jgi:hypothetical protein
VGAWLAQAARTTSSRAASIAPETKRNCDLFFIIVSFLQNLTKYILTR